MRLISYSACVQLVRHAAHRNCNSIVITVIRVILVVYTVIIVIVSRVVNGISDINNRNMSNGKKRQSLA